MKEALHPMRKSFHNDFYALRNISFEVQKGDSLGIIGQNGSGKSTLLKILSKVLTPSSGTFEIHGRVISLLELGSGFNPELTGIENVFFYGTILGFTKKQIDNRLDEILAFADIGQFVYQPLKTYSSGMRSRLAFAVASNVDPDILILDEVLAVGDLRFQQKCLRVMQAFVDRKKTVILVSHDTNAISSFCKKAIWLHSGQVQEFGFSSDIVKKYVGFMTYGHETKPQTKDSKNSDRVSSNEQKQQDLIAMNKIVWTDISTCESFGDNSARIENIALYCKETNSRVDTLLGGEWLSLYVTISVHRQITNPGFGILVKNYLGNGVFTVNNYLHKKPLRSFLPGERITLRTDLKFPQLKNGKYTITIALSDGNQEKHVQNHWVHDAISVSVLNPDPKFGSGANLLVLEDSAYDISLAY
jgi:lipopolysaccharide transport system ATP-binding protein/teichoic acid transport system ATP-binding protein